MLREAGIEIWDVVPPEVPLTVVPVGDATSHLLFFAFEVPYIGAG